MKNNKCSNVRKTTEQFIEEARQVHGDKYDYSKVEYINAKTKVCIICPEHGEFWQTPGNHLRGDECPFCAGNIKLTTKQFIEKARQIHGNKFGYSKVEYVNNNTKVCIICPEHGEFMQTPSNHLFGNGCPKCSENVKLSRSIIEERFLKYCDLHNYELVSINTFDKRLKDIKATCHCPIHNEDFTITLSSVSYRDNINAMKCKGCRSDRQKENKKFYCYTKEEVLNTCKKYGNYIGFDPENHNAV